jgi:predicted  nucleic acid-binding Zn-ribbon protein
VKKIELLRNLQEIDSSLDEVRQELDHCRGRLGDDAELVPLRETLDSARQELKQLRARGKDLDYDIETRTIKMKADEKKLYDGSIRNPKDLGSLAHEVDLEKAQVSKLEDQALSIMEALEAATGAEATAASALTSVEERWRAEQAELEARCSVLVSREAELTARRQASISQIDPATIKGYESLRRMRGGVAVTAVERGACLGCRINLTSSVIQRARAGADLVPCQNCGRYLYVP